MREKNITYAVFHVFPSSSGPGIFMFNEIAAFKDPVHNVCNSRGNLIKYIRQADKIRDIKKIFLLLNMTCFANEKMKEFRKDIMRDISIYKTNIKH